MKILITPAKQDNKILKPDRLFYNKNVPITKEKTNQTWLGGNNWLVCCYSPATGN